MYYVPTYVGTYLPAFVPTYIYTCLCTYIFTCLCFYLCRYIGRYLPIFYIRTYSFYKHVFTCTSCRRPFYNYVTHKGSFFPWDLVKLAPRGEDSPSVLLRVDDFTSWGVNTRVKVIYPGGLCSPGGAN
jgi:hypothetical protein